MAASVTDASSRDYAAIERAVVRGVTGAEARRTLIDLLWTRLAPTGVSWIGFYQKVDGSEEMLLDVRRDKPACSPIGLHGACGRSWMSQKSLIVTDVAKLGAGYIACDPKDRSEVVVPVFGADGACWGVLDADSYDVNAFSQEDAAGLQRVMRAAGVTFGEPAGVEII